MFPTSGSSTNSAHASRPMPAEHNHAAAAPRPAPTSSVPISTSTIQRPPPPNAGAMQQRLATSYIRMHRDFNWAHFLVDNAQVSQASALMALARRAPGGIDARDSDGKTLVEAAIVHPGAHIPSLLRQLRSDGANFSLPDVEGNTLLHRMVMEHNPAAIKLLLDNEVDINLFNRYTATTIARYAKDPRAVQQAMDIPNAGLNEDDNATALHLAAAFGNPAIVRLLLSRGANVHASNRDRLTPLHWAAIFSNDAHAASALIAAGARVNADADDYASMRCSPLSIAAMCSRDAEMLHFLLDHGAQINAKDDEGRTALHMAAVNATHPDILQTLLERGADPNALARDEDTAAGYLLSQASPHIGEMIAQLKAAGADLEKPDRQGNTLLHRVAILGDEAKLRALLDNGVDVNAANLQTHPHIAGYAADPDSARQTLRHPLINMEEHGKATPLHLVAMFGTAPHLVKVLVEHGADINRRDVSGSTPIDWAATFSPTPDIVSTMLEHGAEIDSADPDRIPTFFLAAGYTRTPAVMTALLQGGAQVNALSYAGTSALSHAIEFNSDPEVMHTLLRQGADPMLRNVDGRTPLHCAARQSDISKIHTLLDAGVEINAVDDDGDTPLDYAQTDNAEHPEIAQALIARGATTRPSQDRTFSDLLMNLSNLSTVPTATSERYNDGDVLFAEALAAMSLSSEHARYADSDAASDVSRTSDEERLLDLELRIRTLLASDSDPDAASEFDRHISSAEGTRQLELAAAFLSGAGLSATSSAPSHDRLGHSVEFWFRQTDQQTDPAAAAARIKVWQAVENEPHAAEFKDFLDGLTETADHQDSRLRPEFKQRVATLLTALQNNPALRQQCFMLVEDATTSCGDRIGLTLNNLDMARIEQEAEHGAHSAQGLIDIRTSQFRIQLLGELAQQKITQLRPTLGDRLDEIEIIHGATTLMAEEFNLIGVSRTMLYASYAHFSEDDKRTARALIAQRESRSDYIRFIAEWKPWQQQLRRLRPADFADLDLQVAREQESLSEQPSYTSDNDYVELCRQMESMQRSRLTFSLESWTREWLVQNRQRTPGTH